MTPQGSAGFIDAYFAGFPSVRAFIDRTIAEARSSGVVRTLYGRRRLVPDLSSANVQIRQAAERETVNMPIQGTAADILKLAMIHTHAAITRIPTARMILTVHDERSSKCRLTAWTRPWRWSASTWRMPRSCAMPLG